MDINSSIKTLKRAIINQSNIEINDPDYVKDVKKKIKYYKIFQFYLYVYWVCEAVVLSCKPFLYLYHEWIFSLAHQVVILIGMSLLFITINYTLNYRKRELMVDFAGMPLPFDKERDAQICGEIVIIHNICIDEPNNNRDSDNKSYFPSISIGIERSHHRKFKNAIQHNSIHNSFRIRQYLFEDVEEEAKNDILKIINAQNQDLEENKNCYLNSLTSKKYESGCLEGFNDNENSCNFHCFKLQKFENDCIQFKNNSTNELISPLFQSKVCIDFGDSKRLEAFINFEKFRSKFKEDIYTNSNLKNQLYNHEGDQMPYSNIADVFSSAIDSSLMSYEQLEEVKVEQGINIFNSPKKTKVKNMNEECVKLQMETRHFQINKEDQKDDPAISLSMISIHLD